MFGETFEENFSNIEDVGLSAKRDEGDRIILECQFYVAVSVSPNISDDSNVNNMLFSVT